MDYGKTLNLPKTDFPMKADLPKREPDILNYWEKINIYEKVQEKNQKKAMFILHDGPPYCNGPIHLGQALNKILKDMIVKYKSITGWHSPYVPGWDTHGLPNEISAIKEYKINRKEIPPIELRNKCVENALKFIEVQKKQFQRLGVFAKWDKPYLTLDKKYESAIIYTFRKMLEKNLIFRSQKPVYWCATCETALAEAEIEYKDKVSDSIYVKFLVKDKLSFMPLDQKEPLYVIIWTTTPWTLPGNVAIALHPKEKYSIVNIPDKKEIYVLASERLKESFSEIGITDYKVLAEVNGSELAGIRCQHPFLERDSVLITVDYVTMDQGTGCVHTAPGHGIEDYEAGIKYNLPIIVPVDEKGYLTSEAGPFAQMKTKDANPLIIDLLKKEDNLLKSGQIEHSYAHCWRCKEPIIYRATWQWFMAMDINNIRKRSIELAETVNWYPSWGEIRFKNMLESRPDWCLSRQRIWGVPIPAFKCIKCNDVFTSEEIALKCEELFCEFGSNVWYERKAEDLIPAGHKCSKCNGDEFEKDNTIFDVWFESGVSNIAVLNEEYGLEWPSDIYLEGSDQYRGWFQHSLLPAVAVKNNTPFKTVITHGWVLDDKGHAMHKSLGNVIDPEKIVKEYGTDILRLYFASVDYTSDVKIGFEGFKHISESYRKIRNTCRFMLGNLFDFKPNTDMVNTNDLLHIDKWALQKASQMIDKVRNSYENYEFHVVYSQIHSFCVTTMSAIYLDILKDRLYTLELNSKSRRSAQTAIYRILKAINTIMSPVMPFTAEEIFQAMPETESYSSHSVFLEDWPHMDENFLTKDEEKLWELLIKLRSSIYNIIEVKRTEGILKQAQQADVKLYLPEDYFKILNKYSTELKEVLLVSELAVLSSEKVDDKWIPIEFPQNAFVEIEKTQREKCPRCWNYTQELSNDSEFEGICTRCLNVMKELVRVK